jgi:hypothetical protein
MFGLQLNVVNFVARNRDQRDRRIVLRHVGLIVGDVGEVDRVREQIHVGGILVGEHLDDDALQFGMLPRVRVAHEHDGVAAIPLRHAKRSSTEGPRIPRRRTRELGIAMKRMRGQDAENVVACREELVDRCGPRRSQPNAHRVRVRRL